METVLKLLKARALALPAQAKADVVRHAQVGIEGVALEDHRHIPLGGAQMGHPATAHDDFTAAWALQSGQEAQQRAFAAAGGSDEN
jgi:hypothetical protein